MIQRILTFVKGRATTALGVSLLWLAVVLAVTAYRVAYVFNWIYGNYQLALASLIVVGMMVGAILATIGWRRTVRNTSITTASGVLGALATAVTVATALYGGLQFWSPTTPQSAEAVACRGVPLYGAAAQGQTAATGVNGRTGAGSAYASRSRFGPNCTLGFDGYCLGEGISNVDTNIADQRWLVVHRRPEVVSAALIKLQNAQRNLKPASAKVCARYHGVHGGTLTSWSATALPKGGVNLTSNASGVAIAGFGVEFPPTQAKGGFPYEQIAFYSLIPTTKGFGTSVVWDTHKLSAAIPTSRIALYAVAEACFANDFTEPGSARFLKLIFDKGKFLGTEVLRKGETVPNATDLVQQGCSLE